MNEDIFATCAPRYWDAGLPVIPLRERNKMPAIPQWSTYGAEMPSEAVQQHWLSVFPRGNIGLPFGPASGLCAIDIDTEDEAVTKALLNILPETPWVRVGKKGMGLAYRWNGQRNFKLRGADGGMICEFLGLGNQMVLPPSIHPDTGRPYTATANLWEVLDDIAELDLDIEDKLRAALEQAGVRLQGRARPKNAIVAARADTHAAHLAGIAGWLQDHLGEAKAELGAAKEGARNDTLFKVAVRLAADVCAAGEDWEPYASELTPIAFQIGLEEAETANTLASAWKSGSDTPTPWIVIAREWIYVSGADRLRHLATGETLTQQAFRTEFSNVHPEKKGDIVKFLTKNDFIVKVQDIVFDPGMASGIVEKDGRKWLNVYRPSSVVATPGDPVPFVEFLEYLVPDPTERDHVTKMFAHLVQRPAEKLHHALILGSKAHGIGKSTLMQILFELLGPHNCRKASSEEFETQYNSYVMDTLLVLVEEINLGAGGRRVYNKLKDLITGEEVRVRAMYQDWRLVPNRANFVFLTNLEVPLLLEEGDRRFAVVMSPAQPREPEYYARFNEWWRANLGVIRAYLEQVDLTGFNRFAPPPLTEAKTALIESSRNPVLQELMAMMEEREPPFHVDIVHSRQVIEALRTRLPKATRRAVEDALREAGAVNLGQHRLGDRVQRRFDLVKLPQRPTLLAVRNVGYWKEMPAEERVKEYLEGEARLAGFPELPSLLEYLPASHFPALPRLVVQGDSGLKEAAFTLRDA